MVKIAVAGGSGQIAREIVDALLATKKHEILIFTRKAQTDYIDKKQLISILAGVHTVLSFIFSVADPEGKAEKSLIDAAVDAGVKRFAPSEWGSAKLDELPWYAGKGVVRAYLEYINKEKKVIEYSLFQPGLLADYLTPAGSSSKYLQPNEVYLDFKNRRAIILDGKEDLVTFTTAHDLANVVARAIEYEGEWPVIGGINGSTVSTRKLLEIGAKVRGGEPFDITYLKEEDVRAGDIKSSWIPKMGYVPPEQVKYFSKLVLTGCLLSGRCESWVVSDEWNRLLPDYKFAGLEEFFSQYWEGKSWNRKCSEFADEME